jgi:hypothetical protein
MIKRGLVSPDNADELMMMYAGGGFKFAGEGSANPNMGARKGFSAGRSDMRKTASRTSALGMSNDPEQYPDSDLKDGYGTGAGVGMGPGYMKQRQAKPQPNESDSNVRQPNSYGPNVQGNLANDLTMDRSKVQSNVHLTQPTRTIAQQVQILKSQLTDPLLSWAGRERIEAEIKAIESQPGLHSNPLILTDGESFTQPSPTDRFRGHGSGVAPPKRKREYNPMESQEIDVDFVDETGSTDLPSKQGSKRRRANYFGTSDPYGRGQ